MGTSLNHSALLQNSHLCCLSVLLHEQQNIHNLLILSLSLIFFNFFPYLLISADASVTGWWRHLRATTCDLPTVLCLGGRGHQLQRSPKGHLFLHGPVRNLEYPHRVPGERRQWGKRRRAERRASGGTEHSV